MAMTDGVLQGMLSTKNKLLVFDGATYAFVGIALLAGVLGLPYSLWLVVFREGSFARVLGACLVCVACWFGIRWTAFFRQRIHYIDSLRNHGYSYDQAVQAWNYYLLGKHDALSVELAKRRKPVAPPRATPRTPPSQPARRPLRMQ